MDLLLDEKLGLLARAVALLRLRLLVHFRLVLARSALASTAVDSVQAVRDVLLQLQELPLDPLSILAHLQSPEALPLSHDVVQSAKLGILHLRHGAEQLGVTDPVVVELRHGQDEVLH